MSKIEVRRMDGGTWVKLNMGLAVVPIGLLDEIRAPRKIPLAKSPRI